MEPFQKITLDAFSSAIRLAAIGQFFLTTISGCNAPEAPYEEKPRVAPVQNFRTYSKNESSVTLLWDASESVVSGNVVTDYLLSITLGSKKLASISLPKTAVEYTANSLLEGSPYTFEIVVRPDPSKTELQQSFARFAMMAPTWQYDQTVRLYELGSSIGDDALQLYDEPSTAPFTFHTGSAMDTQIDLFLTGTTLAVKGGDQLSSSFPGKATRFSQTLPIRSSTLNVPMSAYPEAVQYTEPQLLLPTGTITDGIVVWLVTQDGHFARILFLPGPAHSLVSGTAPNRFVDLRLAYQRVPDIRYAKRSIGM